MTSMHISAPLHWRHDFSDARRAIEKRYRSFRMKLGPQVKILQKSKPFRTQCCGLYERGYKDWMILGAVFNQLLQSQMIARGIDLFDSKRALEMARDVMNNSVPIEVDGDARHFCGDQFLRFLYHFNFIALATYGFELGRQMLDAQTVERFLRERLRYFDMDLPHVPLFEKAKGTWPELPAT